MLYKRQAVDQSTLVFYDSSGSGEIASAVKDALVKKQLSIANDNCVAAAFETQL